MQAIKTEETIIGQYTRSLDGKVPGYRDDESVPEDSQCPTFCAAIAHIENQRWAGVPIFLKAGKGVSPPFIPLHLLCFHTLSPN